MFKFIKQYTETITGAQVYPIISLLIFFIFFVVLLVYVKKLDNTKIKEISEIPLENDSNQNQTF